MPWKQSGLNLCWCVVSGDIMTTASVIPLEGLVARFDITPDLVMLTVLRVLSQYSQSDSHKSNSIKLNLWTEFDWVWQLNEIEHHSSCEFDFWTNPTPLEKENPMWTQSIRLCLTGNQTLFEFGFDCLTRSKSIYGLSQIQFDWVQLKFCSIGLIDYARVLFMKAICVWSSMDQVNAELIM